MVFFAQGLRNPGGPSIFDFHTELSFTDLALPRPSKFLIKQFSVTLHLQPSDGTTGYTQMDNRRIPPSAGDQTPVAAANAAEYRIKVGRVPAYPKSTLFWLSFTFLHRALLCTLSS